MKIINEIFVKYKGEIAIVEKSDLQDIKILRKGINLSRKCLNEFSKLVRNHKFESKKNEIKFFKELKPEVEGRLHFFKKAHKFMLAFPNTSNSLKRKSITAEMQKLNFRECKHQDFLSYYRSNQKKLDHIYFIRGVSQLELFLDFSNQFIDPEFNTSHDFLVTKIIAQDLQIEFYKKQLQELKKKKFNNKQVKEKSNVLNDLQWTGTKTELTELLYALNATGVLKNGEAEMKKLVEICKELFNLDLGNIYKTYGEIKAREKEPTKFLDLMKIRLLQKMQTK
ncbi:RteC domain-containing protein [Lutibacter sp. TH_r2]|uniref:RteC domain-containing protein n=1 Tax=Lutibacter sp. TH_r2 TaxID=3082083 RepID=UPI002955D178|nr:RteC domain-containing protein [Lutibacter sp. TH_r2]MDV7188474.1 RteC domain-containing protein [Lutibacter sp. TH_r2]